MFVPALSGLRRPSSHTSCARSGRARSPSTAFAPASSGYVLYPTRRRTRSSSPSRRSSSRARRTATCCARKPARAVVASPSSGSRQDASRSKSCTSRTRTSTGSTRCVVRSLLAPARVKMLTRASFEQAGTDSHCGKVICCREYDPSSSSKKVLNPAGPVRRPPRASSSLRRAS